MICLSQRLKSLRKAREYTQEEVAQAMRVSPQSVSKWERGETYPDIDLLPALANLFGTSVDHLIGMDLIRDEEHIRGLFTRAHALFEAKDYAGAAGFLREQLDTYPGDAALLSEYAFCLSFDENRLGEAASLCEELIGKEDTPVKIRHTLRAALCIMYLKMGEGEKADAAAGLLPHVRESREEVRRALKASTSRDDMDGYIRYLVLGK